VSIFRRGPSKLGRELAAHGLQEAMRQVEALPPRIQKPPRPPGSRPPAEDIWGFGASRATGRGPDGDPCGSGPVPSASSGESEAPE